MHDFMQWQVLAYEAKQLIAGTPDTPARLCRVAVPTDASSSHVSAGIMFWDSVNATHMQNMNLDQEVAATLADKARARAAHVLKLCKLQVSRWW